MSYVHKNLMEDEQVLYEANIPWFVYIPSFLLLLVSEALYFFVVPLLVSETLYFLPLPASIFLLVLAVWSFLKTLIERISTELAVTSKRVIYKTGFI